MIGFLFGSNITEFSIDQVKSIVEIPEGVSAVPTRPGGVEVIVLDAFKEVSQILIRLIHVIEQIDDQNNRKNHAKASSKVKAIL